MLKKICMILLFAGIFIQAFCNENIPVIAIEPILDRIGYYMSHKAYTFQARLSSELVSRYQCAVVSGNMGLSLKNQLTHESVQKQSALMPEPDWIIGGSYQTGRRISDKWLESDIELVWINTAANTMRRQVFREKAGHYNEIKFIADFIAAQLKLEPRKKNILPQTDRSGETWLVMPFHKILSLNDFTHKISWDDSGLLNKIISSSGKNIKLIPQKELENFFNAHRISNLSGLNNPGTASDVGRKMLASKIIAGFITNGPDSNHSRLDLMLIDSQSGVIINAFSGIFKPVAREEFFTHAVNKIINSPDIQIKRSSNRNFYSAIASERIIKLICGAFAVTRNNPVFTEQIIALAETYYLLNINNSPYTKLHFCHELIKNIFVRGCPENWQTQNRTAAGLSAYPVITTEEQSKKLAHFLLPILDTVQHCSLVEYPDSNGKLRFKLLLNAGRFIEALEIYKKRLYNSYDLTEWDLGVLEAVNGNFRTAGDIFRKNKYYMAAVYAYYLAKDEKLAYQTASMQKPFFMPHSMETVIIYLKLLEKFESPQAALKWFDDYCKYAEKNSNHLKNNLFNVRLDKNIENAVKKLRGKVSPVKFEDCSRFFKKMAAYPVYFQSLNEFPAAEMRRAAELLQKHTGLKTIILPERKIPNHGVYDSGKHSFNSEKIVRAVRYAFAEKYPPEGLLMMCVTFEAVNKFNINVFAGWEGDCCGLATFSAMPLVHDGVDAGRTLALTAGRYVIYNSVRSTFACINYPCMFASVNNFKRCNDLDFKICSECMEKVLKANPKRALKRFNNSNYLNYYTEEEKNNFKIYRKEIF